MALVLKTVSPTDDTVLPFIYCPNDPTVVRSAIKQCASDGIIRIVMGDNCEAVGVVIVEGKNVMFYSNDDRLKEETF